MKAILMRLAAVLLLTPVLCVAQVRGTVRGMVRDSVFREPLALTYLPRSTEASESTINVST